MIVVTTDKVDGRTHTPVGLVREAVCISKSAAADIVANVKNWTVGGELTSYSDMIRFALDQVIDRLGRSAQEAGADAVVGFRITTSNVASGAAELIAYGTAVRLANESTG